MPQLRKKLLDRPGINAESIRDDEEVFYCEITNEIFRSYEDFAEKMFLCNSMVWTCTMTGKTNLTYSEALESEERALRVLNDFPIALKRPILYLVTLTKRTGLSDLVDDIFAYIKDHFFHGETVLCCQRGGTHWETAKVLKNIDLNHRKNGSIQSASSSNQYSLQLSTSKLYVEVDTTQIRRKYQLLTKDKCKLYLKQSIQTDLNGVFIVKPAVLFEFNLRSAKFDDFHDGPPPVFHISKKIIPKQMNNNNNNTVSPSFINNNVNKKQQMTLETFLSANSTKHSTNNSEKNLLEEMRKRCEEFKALKQERKELERQKKKEDDVRLANFMREWYKPKEDLELEDQKILPVPIPIRCPIPIDYLGEVFMLIEFVNSFNTDLKTAHYFPNGFSIELAERALISNELSGPVIDLLQLLLETVVNLESTEGHLINPDDNDNTRNGVNKHDNVYGMPLPELPIYTCTVSEILRLHLTVNKNDDNLIAHFCQSNPDILNDLNHKHYVELDVGARLEILICLMHQILTYPSVRDRIDKRQEKNRQSKTELRSQQVAIKKHQQEFTANRLRLQREEKDTKILQDQLSTMRIQHDEQLAKLEKQILKTVTLSYKHQVVLGQDRAYRTYYQFQHIPGIFIYTPTDRMDCLKTVTTQNPHLVNADHKQTVAYWRSKLHSSDDNVQLLNCSSDKENNSLSEPRIEEFAELLMCSSVAQTCPVHNVPQSNWCVVSDLEQFDQLIASLNRRGVRERELQMVLKENRLNFNRCIENTPMVYLNKDYQHPNKIDEETAEKDQQHQKKLSKTRTCTNPNLGYPIDMPPDEILENMLCDSLLELEEKLYMGNLGTLRVPSRADWRSNLEQKRNFNDPLNCLAQVLLQISQSIEMVYLKRPLGNQTSRTRKKNTVGGLLPNWQESLMKSQSFSQVFLHHDTLEKCVLWSKSTLRAKCKLCRRGKDSDIMLLCDACNSGFHLYCLKPKLKSVPDGDWYCTNCEAARKADSKPIQKLIVQCKDEESDVEDDFNKSDDEMSDILVDEDECHICHLKGDLINCTKCLLSYHHSCLEPPLKRPPRGSWTCRSCMKNNKRPHSTEIVNGTRKLRFSIGSRRQGLRSCATKARNKIHNVVMSLRQNHYESGTDNEDLLSDEENQSNEDEEDDEINRHRIKKRRLTDTPLHNAILHELLVHIMKSNEAWPFLRPVLKNAVPDYYDVITKPMDFGTIKYKLNMGDYKRDEEFMSDALLVFHNCNLYNQVDDDVYKCGEELFKRFQKKCQDLGLEIPEDEYTEC